jgi:sorbitol-specific phosphotransferase system component IIBC
MAKKETQKEKTFHEELMTQLVTLSTSGFGLVAALAWNEAVQSFVDNYVNHFFPSQSGFVSKLIYALIITGFAVFITYQLSRLASRFGTKK